MTFKLLQEAEKRWKRIRGYEQLGALMNGVAVVGGNVLRAPNHSVGDAA
jgi:hypothetical protein